jgi:hypothetical protein
MVDYSFLDDCEIFSVLDDEVDYYDRYHDNNDENYYENNLNISIGSESVVSDEDDEDYFNSDDSEHLPKRCKNGIECLFRSACFFHHTEDEMRHFQKNKL